MESNLQIKIGTREPILQWAVRWAAMLVTRYLVGKDGRTAQERKRGRPCKSPLAEFGETVWYKPFDKNKDRNKVEPKWEQGVWLGISRESNETLIGTKGGVIRCYSIKRLPNEEKWIKEMVLEMQGTPQQPNPSKSGLRIPIRLEAEGDIVGGASGPPQVLPEGRETPLTCPGFKQTYELKP